MQSDLSGRWGGVNTYNYVNGNPLSWVGGFGVLASVESNKMKKGANQHRSPTGWWIASYIERAVWDGNPRLSKSSSVDVGVGFGGLSASPGSVNSYRGNIFGDTWSQ